MTQLGLPLSFPIKIGGESYTLRDILRDAIASFDLHQGEIEWTAIAYATYLPPYRQWINKFGDRYSFDDLVKELLKRRFDRGSCCGCHVLEGMIVLERTDRQVAHLLSDEVRRQLQTRLREVVATAIAHQACDGSWGPDWHLGLEPPSGNDESPDRQSEELRLLATSHLAHSLMYLSGDRRVPSSVLLRAGKWLHATLERANPAFVRENLCPCCHGAWVVCTLAAQTSRADDVTLK
jgi:hypothetical protein